MVVSRFCRGRNIRITTKLVFSGFLFVLTVQLTYLRTLTVDDRRENHVVALLTQRSQINEVSFSGPDKVISKEPDKPKPPFVHNNAPPLKYFPDLFFKPPFQPLVYGKPRQNKGSSRSGYLTIGIPSVQRPNTERIYLYDTLNSIIEKIPEFEQHQITIIVMISDTNKTYNSWLSFDVYNKYRSFCDSGMIHILNTVEDIYPDLDNVKQTFNDSKSRLKWRAKQNIDFAFMMLYSWNLSDFYMQLEDDVVVATDFFQDIRTFITKTSQRWFLLEFSRLGFIGKLFRSSDLKYASMFLLKYYDWAPCDLLLGPMRTGKGQKKSIHSNISLFQHIGRFSSLKNKLMPSLDKTFKDAAKLNMYLNLPLGDNPSANITSSFLTYGTHIPQHAYDNDNTTYFWGKTPKEGDNFILIFEKPYNFSRIIIPTGALGTKRDSFLYSSLMYSESTLLQASNNKNICVSKFMKLVDMLHGDSDTMATGTVIPANIKCLGIKATKNLTNWVIIRDIQLFLKH